MAEEHLKLIFKEERHLATSVNPAEFKTDAKYDESLEEYLHPTFEQNDVQQGKKNWKKLKTHVQALGIKQTENFIATNEMKHKWKVTQIEKNMCLVKTQI